MAPIEQNNKTADTFNNSYLSAHYYTSDVTAQLDYKEQNWTLPTRGCRLPKTGKNKNQRRRK